MQKTVQVRMWFCSSWPNLLPA